MQGPANATATFMGGRKSTGFKFANPNGDLMHIDADGNVNITGKLFINGEEVTAGGGGGFWEEESPGVIKYSGTAKATTLIGTG
jgi:hypothetical protein